MKVTDPEGQVWHVHRRWLPWNPGKGKKLGKKADGFDGLDILGSIDDLPSAVVLGLAAIALVFLIPIVAVVILTGIELLLLLVVLPFAVIGRMLVGRRWWVQVRRGWRLQSEEMVGDWTASGARVREIAKGIQVHSPAATATAPRA